MLVFYFMLVCMNLWTLHIISDLNLNMSKQFTSENKKITSVMLTTFFHKGCVSCSKTKCQRIKVLYLCSLFCVLELYKNYLTTYLKTMIFFLEHCGIHKPFTFQCKKVYYLFVCLQMSLYDTKTCYLLRKDSFYYIVYAYSENT